MWYIHNKQNEKIMEEISRTISVVEDGQNIESEVKKEERDYEVDFNTLKKVSCVISSAKFSSPHSFKI